MMATITSIKENKLSSLEVTTTVLPESTRPAGRQTPQGGAAPQSVSPQWCISGGQPREDCVSSSCIPDALEGPASRARLDFLRFHVEEQKRVDMQYSAAIKNKLNESCVLEEYTEPLANKKTFKALEANPYAVLHDEGDGKCSLSGRLRARAERLVKFYEELGMTRSAKEIPQHIICGGLRPAVRQCFVDQISPVDELSFKTIQKLEKSCCKECEPRFLEKLSQWKEARFQPVAVDMEHLGRFRRAFRQNVEKGWDRQRAPFIPNGNATRRFRRREGGNWNVEEFSVCLILFVLFCYCF